MYRVRDYLEIVRKLQVATYIQKRCAEGKLQAIVISLKEDFYGRAAGLVGVCRDATTEASRTLTLDLSAIGGPGAGGAGYPATPATVALGPHSASASASASTRKVQQPVATPASGSSPVRGKPSAPRLSTTSAILA